MSDEPAPVATLISLCLSLFVQCYKIEKYSAQQHKRHRKVAHNFGSDASNFMKHHDCLCNDFASQLDLVLDQLGLIHCPFAANTLNIDMYFNLLHQLNLK